MCIGAACTVLSSADCQGMRCGWVCAAAVMHCAGFGAYPAAACAAACTTVNVTADSVLHTLAKWHLCRADCAASCSGGCMQGRPANYSCVAAHAIHAYVCMFLTFLCGQEPSMERPVLLLMHATLPSTMCAAQSVTASGRVGFALGHCCTHARLVKRLPLQVSALTDGCHSMWLLQAMCTRLKEH